MIPRIDAQAFLSGEEDVVATVCVAAREVGVLTVYNTPVPLCDIKDVFAAYRPFFLLPAVQTEAVNMARTGTSRASIPVSVPVGEFVIDFGEMLEMWTDGLVVATPHRVIGFNTERMSAALFYNRNGQTNLAPVSSGQTIGTVDHLQKRFDETDLHLQNKS
ncbi:MAG: 2-oxoglutarate and iron-dependent oxygenase domain-containing protein [Yoonia sp.]|uniref:2-oxoglutarate and iron-dependent oxygenase domain-containing protein n=1 Tax=Yoonia sp. TaxID=2212373 RepID=UPI003EF476F0